MREVDGGSDAGRGDDGAINFKNSYKTGSSRRSNKSNSNNNEREARRKPWSLDNRSSHTLVAGELHFCPILTELYTIV